MNWGAFLGLTAVFAVLMLIVQRAERKRRLVTLVVMLAGAELVRRYLVYRGWDTEGLLAVLAALVLNCCSGCLSDAAIRRNPATRSRCWATTEADPDRGRSKKPGQFAPAFVFLIRRVSALADDVERDDVHL